MPQLYLFGGPNGAGKTTIALKALADLGNIEFVNADSIAKGLSPFHPESVAVEAGKLMLSRMRFLILQEKNLGFESTLASRSFAKLIRSAKSSGYTFHLIFVYLQNVELAISRVQCRVASGGHNIPEQSIIRRYQSGLFNFKNLYLPLCDSFIVFDNSGFTPRVVAEKYQAKGETEIYDRQLWSRIVS